jgi:hypothetical protein
MLASSDTTSCPWPIKKIKNEVRAWSLSGAVFLVMYITRVGSPSPSKFGRTVVP